MRQRTINALSQAARDHGKNQCPHGVKFERIQIEGVNQFGEKVVEFGQYNGCQACAKELEAE